MKRINVGILLKTMIQILIKMYGIELTVVSSKKLILKNLEK